MDRKKEKIKIDVIIGANIRFERETRKMSREELGRILGFETSHLGLIERGERGATSVTLSLLAKTFGITIDSLFMSPHPRGQSVYTEDEATKANREKVQSMASCLDKSELEFTVRLLKGIIEMNHSKAINDKKVKDEK